MAEKTPFDVLYEDNHLLVLGKPAGLPTMGVAEHETSLYTLAKDYLKRKYHKPGNVYLGVVSRLDAMVSGVIVLARTSKAAARLSEQFRDGDVEKRYWAVIEQPLSPADGECVDWVKKDDERHRMFVTRSGDRDAQEARLRYRTLARLDRGALLEVELETGRKHQIRVQLAARGSPVWGDVKYDGRERFPVGIALHSRVLAFSHPVRKTPLRFECPLPASWALFGDFR